MGPERLSTAIKLPDARGAIRRRLAFGGAVRHDSPPVDIGCVDARYQWQAFSNRDGSGSLLCEEQDHRRGHLRDLQIQRVDRWGPGRGSPSVEWDIRFECSDSFPAPCHDLQSLRAHAVRECGKGWTVRPGGTVKWWSTRARKQRSLAGRRQIWPARQCRRSTWGAP